MCNYTFIPSFGAKKNVKYTELQLRGYKLIEIQSSKDLANIQHKKTET